jgi:hypothetical protein
MGKNVNDFNNFSYSHNFIPEKVVGKEKLLFK